MRKTEHQQGILAIEWIDKLFETAETFFCQRPWLQYACTFFSSKVNIHVGESIRGKRNLKISILTFVLTQWEFSN